MLSSQPKHILCRKQARVLKPAARDRLRTSLIRRNAFQSTSLAACQPARSQILPPAAAAVQPGVTGYQNSIVPAQSLVSSSESTCEPKLPVYVSLGIESGITSGSVACQEALKSGLKALKCIGVHGVVVEVWWGHVEDEGPLQYNWDAYRLVFRTLKELGLKAKAFLCFHSTSEISLPSWVLEAGHEDPDIFFADRNGNRRQECLSLGIDQVPALAGRTATDVYQDFMMAFKEEFQQYFGSTIQGALIGMGPDGELKYPAQPRDAGWAFPGVGEFQCYDRFMLSSLRACAEAVNEPSWGLDGPHDAGTYCQWPDQSRFFSHDGSWSSPYGSFFLQWYASALIQHADTMLGIAHDVFSTSGVQLSVKLPAVYWWYNHTCHSAEMTAGINSAVHRDGYLPIMKCLQSWDAVAELPCAEMSNADTPDYAMCNPEELLMQQRAAAAALQVPFALNNFASRFDAAAVGRLEHNVFAKQCHRGVDLTPATSMTIHRVGTDLFESTNWLVFKAFLRRLRGRLDAFPVDEAPAPVPVRAFRTAPVSTSIKPGSNTSPVREGSQKQQMQTSPILV